MNPIPFYLAAAILFILAIRGLASPATARRGNILGIAGMIIAVAAALTILPTYRYFGWIILFLVLGAAAGIYAAVKVKMTSLPQMIAAFNGLGGLAAVFIAFGEIDEPGINYDWSGLGMIIGALAFSGSAVAFAKLQGLVSGKPFNFRFQHPLNFILLLLLAGAYIVFAVSDNLTFFYLSAALSFVVGVLLLLPIGGADMPVIISVLNSYSGWAAAGIGFSLNNIVLIITGAIVGASGAILSYVMTKSMNSSLLKIMLGGFGHEAPTQIQDNEEDKTARAGSPEDAAFIMENASLIIIVPGYGLAAAHAQHAVKEMADVLRKKYGVDVKFAIHPVAGRMPGHMNVLLAEANVPYDDVFELDEINREFAIADVAYVIGANDITNPSAKDNPNSPLYGMPVLDVGAAKTVFFVKRSLAAGYSGVDNPLFYADNTIMLYGDAKKVTEEIVGDLEAG